MAFLGVLPEQPGFGQLLGRGLGQGLGSGLSTGIQSSIEQRRKLELEKLRGKSLAQEVKQLEKVKQMEGALGTIERMRELLHLAGGFTSAPITKLQSLFPGETQRGRAELEALGRSLIPMVAAGVPIRNQREFSEYSKIITDPDASPSQLEGALDGIQNILQRSIGSAEEREEEMEMPRSRKEETMPVKMRTPDGKIVNVPKNMVKQAMQAGGKVVR